MRTFGGSGPDPAFLKSSLHDVFFVLLDRDRRLIDAQHARGFTRRGTDAAGELRKVIGGVQLPNRFLPAPAIHQIVPVGNQIVDRAARLAERHAAIHAARALLLERLLGKIEIDFEPVVDPLR